MVDRFNIACLALEAGNATAIDELLAQLDSFTGFANCTSSKGNFKRELYGERARASCGGEA